MARLNGDEHAKSQVGEFGETDHRQPRQRGKCP
jgi:hypothetical protein